MPDTTFNLFPLAIGGAAAVVSGAALLAYSVFSPRCQFWAPVVRSLPQAEAVALTFDDGPSYDHTPRILDILAEHQTKATFFLIGRHAKAHPKLVQRMAAEGHALGNHTYDHDHFGINHNRAYWHGQIMDTQALIADLTGHQPVLFRPPMGFKTWHIAAAAQAARLPIIGWSVRAYDTKPLAPQALATRLLLQISGHDIVLLHDGIDPHRRAQSATQAHTVEALPLILQGIKEKNLRTCTVTESLLAGAADRERATARIRQQAAS